MAKKTEK